MQGLPDNERKSKGNLSGLVVPEDFVPEHPEDKKDWNEGTGVADHKETYLFGLSPVIHI